MNLREGVGELSGTLHPACSSCRVHVYVFGVQPLLRVLLVVLGRRLPLIDGYAFCSAVRPGSAAQRMMEKGVQMYSEDHSSLLSLECGGVMS